MLQDLPNAMTLAEVTDRLGLNQLRERRWYIQVAFRLFFVRLLLFCGLVFSWRSCYVPSLLFFLFMRWSLCCFFVVFLLHAVFLRSAASLLFWVFGELRVVFVVFC